MLADRLKPAILEHLRKTGRRCTRHDLASDFNTSTTTITAALQPLVDTGKVLRAKTTTERGQRAFAYFIRGVEQHHDKRGWDFYTAPCPGCGHRRRLVKRPDGYYLIHCGVGQRVEV